VDFGRVSDARTSISHRILSGEVLCTYRFHSYPHKKLSSHRRNSTLFWTEKLTLSTTNHNKQRMMMPPCQPTHIDGYKTNLDESMSFKLNQHCAIGTMVSPKKTCCPLRTLTSPVNLQYLAPLSLFYGLTVAQANVI
jgi:hypothetical protein